jgi:Ca-activated chloride channel family protein
MLQFIKEITMIAQQHSLPNISRLIFTSVLVVIATVATACSAAQAPQASKARSRAVINAGAIVPAEEIRVAEYLQYYDQHFLEPEKEAVGLDLRLGNSRMPAQGGPAWLQIGLQTKSAASEIVAPLNIALVIDRSGSMDAPDKMPYLKQSLRIFLEGLHPDDIVSLVAYSDQAEVLQPAQPVGDGRWIRHVIDNIYAGGSTNLHAGMEAGFQEVERNFDIRRNNRVILLTDGIANLGVTDPTQIAAAALTYNERGIYLSTIGLGVEFNDALLIKLADQGQGGYAFVDSAQEMDRIFREHVNGLKQRVASEVSVAVIPESDVRLVGLSGLDGPPPSEGANVPLWPLGTGDSSVIVAELRVGPAHLRTGLRPLARVQLSYFDEFAQRPVTVEQTVFAEIAPNLPGYDPTWDLEILRNVTIQQLAEGMHEIDHLFQAGRYEAAWRLAVNLEIQLAEAAQLTGDDQLRQDIGLIQRYQETLADAVWATQNRRPRMNEVMETAPTYQRPYRGHQDFTTPTASVPTVNVD